MSEPSSPELDAQGPVQEVAKKPSSIAPPPSVPPRPSSPPGSRNRTGTLQGAASVPPPAPDGDHASPSHPVTAPSPAHGVAIPPLSRLPTLDDDDSFAPHTGFASDGPVVEAPPPANRFATPMPPRPAADIDPPTPVRTQPIVLPSPNGAARDAEAASDGDYHARRRSRRTVRIPLDDVPSTTPAPPGVHVRGAETPQPPAAEIAPSTRPRAEFYSEPGADPAAGQRSGFAHAPEPAYRMPTASQPGAGGRAPLDSGVGEGLSTVEPDVLVAGARPASKTAVSPRSAEPGAVTAEAAAFEAGPPPIPEAAYLPSAPRVAPAAAAPAPVAPKPPPEPEDPNIIRPIRIISVGQSADSERAAAVRAAAAAATSRPISRPPMHAVADLDAFVAPPPPATPDIEEVEVEDEEPETAPKGAKFSAIESPRTEEIDSIEEIDVDRFSDAEADEESTLDDVAVEVDEPRKAPPPPPKRTDTPLHMKAVADPNASPPPPAVSDPRPAASEPIAKAPPPPPQRAAAAAPAAPEPARKRQKAWWEELFGDDFLRTMDHPEPKTIKRECDFLEDRLGVEKGAVVLDLCCGTGSHAVELATRGYSVVGYDLSLAMLAHAADEAQEKNQRINFLQGDMREMAFQDMFDAVYCWSTSFGYFEDEKNVDVLDRIRKALRPGGVLLLDLTNRDYVAARQPSLVWFEGEGCVCMDEMSVDFFTSRLKVKRTVMFEDGRAREIEYSIRLYGLHELGKMLHDVGFKVIEVTGHPAHPGVFFGSESPRIIVLAERDG